MGWPNGLPTGAANLDPWLRYGFPSDSSSAFLLLHVDTDGFVFHQKNILIPLLLFLTYFLRNIFFFFDVNGGIATHFINFVRRVIISY